MFYNPFFSFKSRNVYNFHFYHNLILRSHAFRNEIKCLNCKLLPCHIKTIIFSKESFNIMHRGKVHHVQPYVSVTHLLQLLQVITQWHNFSASNDLRAGDRICKSFWWPQSYFAIWRSQAPLLSPCFLCSWLCPDITLHAIYYAPL